MRFRSLLLVFCIVSSASGADNSEETKNTHFFNTLSRFQLQRTMNFMRGSLGVHCDFCHVRNEDKKEFDFASDDKPEKDIAREMMRMTTEINTKYFNFENSSRSDTITVVKCATCHRGDPHPDEFEMPKEEHNDMPPKGEGKPDNRQ